MKSITQRNTALLALWIVLFANLATAMEKKKSQDVVLRFPEKEITTTFEALCPLGTMCYFTSYKEGRFSPSSHTEKYGKQQLPVISFKDILWEDFKSLDLLRNPLENL